MREIARLTGLSTATVSRVANDDRHVSDGTRRKVLSAMSRLNYRLNSHAAELGRANSGISRRRNNRVTAKTDRGMRLGSRAASKTQPARHNGDRLQLLEKENHQLKQLIAKLKRELRIADQ
jgi:transcriptional regulator with XRE-family HTH domain